MTNIDLISLLIILGIFSSIGPFWLGQRYAVWSRRNYHILGPRKAGRLVITLALCWIWSTLTLLIGLTLTGLAGR